MTRNKDTTLETHKTKKKQEKHNSKKTARHLSDVKTGGGRGGCVSSARTQGGKGAGEKEKISRCRCGRSPWE